MGEYWPSHGGSQPNPLREAKIGAYLVIQSIALGHSLAGKTDPGAAENGEESADGRANDGDQGERHLGSEKSAGVE